MFVIFLRIEYKLFVFFTNFYTLKKQSGPTWIKDLRFRTEMRDPANPVNEPGQPNAMEESGERESVG
jgi:hypothetical protein